MDYAVQYPVSVFLYFFVLAVSELLIKMAVQSKNNYKLWLISLVTLLTLFMGLRCQSVGTDTSGYFMIFEKCSSGVNSFHNAEIGFRFLTWMYMAIFHQNTQIVLIIYSLMICILIVDSLWRLKNIVSLQIGFLCLYLSLYIVGFNILRQTLAMCIVLWGISYLFTKKKIIFCFFIFLVACLIHVSAIISLVVLVIYYFFIQGSHLDLKSILRGTLIITATAAAIVFMLRTERLSSRIDMYLNDTNLILNVSTFFTLSVVIIIWLLSLSHDFSRNEECYLNYLDSKVVYFTCMFAYLLGVILTSIFNSYSVVNRTFSYLTLLNFVFWAYIDDNERIKSIKRMYIVLYSLYTLFNILRANGYGIMPYISCLE